MFLTAAITLSYWCSDQTVYVMAHAVDMKWVPPHYEFINLKKPGTLLKNVVNFGR